MGVPNTSRPPSGSRYSTTTARSGRSSRCTSSLAFAIDRIKAMAPRHPEWKDKEPFETVLAGDLKTALAGGETAVFELVMAADAEMTTEEFEKTVRDWIATAKHSRTGKLYN